MDTATDYDWLFPRGQFSRQAKILETHLLYSGSLSARSQGADILRKTHLPSSHHQLRTSHKEHPIASQSLMTVAKRDLVRLSATHVLPVPLENGLFPRPEDGLLISKLQHDLSKKEREVLKASQGLQKETLEGVKLRGENQVLGQQLEQTSARIGQLEAQLGLQDRKLASREKAVAELNQFLHETAEKQSQARATLKVHMEELIERAESAEKEVVTLRSVSHTPRSLQPAGSMGTLGSDDTGVYFRSRRDQDQIHPKGRQELHVPTWNASTLQSSNHSIQPVNDWSSPRDFSPDHLPSSSSDIQTSARYSTNQYPELGIGPAVLDHDSDGNRLLAVINADSGVGSFCSGNQLSAAGSTAQLTSKSRPHSEKGVVPYRIPQQQSSRNLLDKSQSFTNGPEQITNTQGACASRESLQAESLIEPTMNPALLQSSPAHQSPGNPAISNRPWDLNFLTGVMEDVLKNREAKKRLEMSNPSRAGQQQLNQSNVNSVSTGQSHSPVQAYRPDVTPSPLSHHWSSSDYDDDDDDDDDDDTDETNSAKQQIHHSNRPVRSNVRAPSAQAPHWQVVWLSVFAYLDTETLLTCAEVCRGWRAVSKHPSLWQRVRLANHKISSKFLQTISQWSKGLQQLHLEGLKPRSRAQGESREKYAKSIRGSLEPGLEYMLIAAGAGLITLKIVDCSNILTERSLFLASCYCRNLYSLTYISQTDPIGHEVIWALGAGCRNIASLKVPPRQPCHQHQRLSNRCLQMIGRCWPLLLALSVGGPSIDINGLVSVARNCPRLQVLELDHLPEVTEVIAVAMCQAGLRGLHTLILRNTLISPAAIMQFNGACPQLKSLSVYLSPSICGGDNRDFHNIVSRLRALTKRRVLSEVLHVFAKFN
ncbi:F-box only protein 41-like [Patiria miniata]|uniref:F-box domain-containing protein n=1 Tax=Patiria miniata TaxID=46514 RepID=A0A914B682_PATMI|nr:F-box only protein 41-like [Patiria miniata]XP_038070973.1 F-box only protein 41-like [Patiria miniata]XP_038070974.1 F-box only protein 41-like [Patiria miniata]